MKHSILIFLSVLAFSKAVSQVSIQSPIATDELVCPAELVEYSIKLPTGSSVCSISWQITDGTGNFFNQIDDEEVISITWDDQNPNKVEVQASVDYIDPEGNCTSPENAVVTFEHVLRSVFQETGVVFTEVGIIKIEPVHIYLQPKALKVLQPAPKVYI